MTVRYTVLPSPLDDLLVTMDDTGALTRLHFAPHTIGPELVRAPEAFHAVDAQLAAYFAGELRTFDLPLAPEGTPFQQAVWKGLQEIRFGATLGYGELAQRLGHRGAARAVGSANNRNPIAIIVPCHRVIGSTGAPVGYGGGVQRKHWLLRHEREVLAPTLFG